MARMIFVNLPVVDLHKSASFYAALGFENMPQFTNENAAAMQWSDTIVVMLLKHDFWRTFTDKAIPDAKTHCQVLLSISCDDRGEVDRLTETAGSSGGRSDPNPKQDHGFMYGRSFEDPDGHVWEPSWMDPKVASGEINPATQEV